MVATCQCIFSSDFITKCPIKQHLENYGYVCTLLSAQNGYGAQQGLDSEFIKSWTGNDVNTPKFEVICFPVDAWL